MNPIAEEILMHYGMPAVPVVIRGDLVIIRISIVEIF